MPQAGKLRHLVRWMLPNEAVKSGFNEPGVATLAAGVQVGLTYASIEPLSGTELWQARQVQAETTHKIRVRWKPTLTITAKMVAQYQGRLLNVLEVLNAEERNIELEILAKEVIP